MFHDFISLNLVRVPTAVVKLIAWHSDLQSDFSPAGQGGDRELRPLQDGEAAVRGQGYHPGEELAQETLPRRRPRLSTAAAHAGQGAGGEAVLVQGKANHTGFRFNRQIRLAVNGSAL